MPEADRQVLLLLIQTCRTMRAGSRVSEEVSKAAARRERLLVAEYNALQAAPAAEAANFSRRDEEPEAKG